MMAGNMIGDNGKLCRLCLSEAEVMCPIFASKNGPQGVALPQRIMSCAQIKIVEDDGLPSAICHQCLAQVDKSYQFKLQCEKSDATLRQHMQEKLDSEADGWDVMNFTPEVIINEGDTHDQTDKNGEHFESESDESLKSLTQPYHLSAVEALLRHHGTEIKIQGASPNNHETRAPQVVPSNGSSEHMYPRNGEDYYPLYGVEAVLTPSDMGQAGPSAKLQIDTLKVDRNRQFDDKLKRKRELSRVRVNRYRKKKQEEARRKAETSAQNNEQIQQKKLERKRELSRKRSEKYRRNKRLCVIQSMEHELHDSQIPGPSNRNPPLVKRKQRTTIHNSQISRTSMNMNIPKKT